jgi:adenylate cyclase
MSQPPTDASSASRRLHGVLLADMTGFSRLMGEDESRAVAALMRIRDIFATVVPQHGGTLDVFVGDCFVALFHSAVDAVQAAIAIQTELVATAGPHGDPVRIRIGIHMGDVVRSGNEILGDSVNVAARIQAIAPPGGITVSEDVYRAVRNRVKVPARDLGLKSLKNIRERMRIYVLDPSGVAGEEAPPRRPLPQPHMVLVAGVVLLSVGVGLAYLFAPRSIWPDRPTIGSNAKIAGDPQHPDQLTVGVTGVTARGDVPAWMQDTTRDGLNTLLSKVGRLRVFSREKIDFLRERRGLTEIEVAETLGIEKMISGSMAMQGDQVQLEVRVVDISTGILDASESRSGPPEGLIEVQNQVASSLIAALGVDLSPEQHAELFEDRTKETLNAYRRMLDTFGEAPEEAPAPAGDGRSSRVWWSATAWAADDGHAEVLALMESYRAALEREDADAVAATHVSLTDEQRAGFARYFASADELVVTLSDVEVLFDGEEALVTFTRRDVFKDRDSGKPVELEVRLSTIVVRQDGRWLMRGVRRSS